MLETSFHNNLSCITLINFVKYIRYTKCQMNNMQWNIVITHNANSCAPESKRMNMIDKEYCVIYNADESLPKRCLLHLEIRFLYLGSTILHNRLFHVLILNKICGIKLLSCYWIVLVSATIKQVSVRTSSYHIYILKIEDNNNARNKSKRNKVFLLVKVKF